MASMSPRCTLIVSVDEQCAARLLDPHDFKSFRFVSQHPASEREAVAGALTGIGGILDDEHAWIPIAWIRRQTGLAQDSDWQMDLQGCWRMGRGEVGSMKLEDWFVRTSNGGRLPRQALDGPRTG